MTTEDRPPRLSGLAKGLLLGWMGAVTFVFVAVSIPPDAPFPTVVLEFVMRARDVLLPWFFSPALL